MENKKFCEDLILENLYSAINHYNDIKNNFSFVFFINEIHKAYTFLFIYVLESKEGNNYKIFKKDQSKTPDFLKIAHYVHEKYLNQNGKRNENSIPKFIQGMKDLNTLRGTYYHNPFFDEINKNSLYFLLYEEKNADQFLKKFLKNFIESLITNYIFIFKFFFDIEEPKFSFINFNSSIPNGKALKEKFNKNKELKNIYDYYFTKKETLINIDDYFGSEALLKKILEEKDSIKFKYYETYLNKEKKITGRGAYNIYYSLQLSNEFIEISDSRKNWIKKHYFPNNKNNGLNAKGYSKNLIPYIRYIIDHYPKSDLIKNHKNKNPFSLDDIKKWEQDNFDKYN